MISTSLSTIDLLRTAVGRVTSLDMSDYGLDKDLNLDSINRISLLVELENLFQVQLDSAGIKPEIFDTLASLAGFVEGHLPGHG